jgi:hypothetical protein
MKTYIATGEKLEDLEEKLEQYEIRTYRYKHVDAMSITTDIQYETLTELCTDYTLTSQKNDYDTQNNR